jgi:prepilin-type processing-associated H-X9-DG protein
MAWVYGKDYQMNTFLKRRSLVYASNHAPTNEIIFALDSWRTTPFKNHTGQVVLRHSGKANVLFLDGHVSVHNGADLVNNREWVNYEPQTWSGWHNWNMLNFRYE